jgi:hypothetical protein
MPSRPKNQSSGGGFSGNENNAMPHGPVLRISPIPDYNTASYAEKCLDLMNCSSFDPCFLPVTDISVRKQSACVV